MEIRRIIFMMSCPVILRLLDGTLTSVVREPRCRGIRQPLQKTGARSATGRGEGLRVFRSRRSSASSPLASHGGAANHETKGLAKTNSLSKPFCRIFETCSTIGKIVAFHERNGKEDRSVRTSLSTDIPPERLLEPPATIERLRPSPLGSGCLH